MKKLLHILQNPKKLGLSLDDAFIAKVTKGMGPSIYNADSETIAASDPEELNRVKQNFLIKKLGLKDGPDLDKALEEVITAIGKSNKNKYRVLVYALLAKKFKKESVYQ